MSLPDPRVFGVIPLRGGFVVFFFFFFFFCFFCFCVVVFWVCVLFGGGVLVWLLVVVCCGFFFFFFFFFVCVLFGVGVGVLVFFSGVFLLCWLWCFFCLVVGFFWFFFFFYFFFFVVLCGVFFFLGFFFFFLFFCLGVLVFPGLPPSVFLCPPLLSCPVAVHPLPSFFFWRPVSQRLSRALPLHSFFFVFHNFASSFPRANGLRFPVNDTFFVMLPPLFSRAFASPLTSVYLFFPPFPATSLHDATAFPFPQPTVPGSSVQCDGPWAKRVYPLSFNLPFCPTAFDGFLFETVDYPFLLPFLVSPVLHCVKG